MAIKYIEDKKLLYEVNEKGDRVLVRSTDSSCRAYLRFTNKTSRPVDIWWRDFRGTKHHYISLEPRSHYDINTYITHPWEFTDTFSKEKYVINNSMIFRPPPNLGGMMYRTNWNITIGVRSLRHTALMFLGERIINPGIVSQLGLPRVLEAELLKLVMTLHGAEPATEQE